MDEYSFLLLRESLDGVRLALEAALIPQWERWLSIGASAALVFLTLAAVYVASKSADFAAVSARSARDALDYARLQDLLAHYTNEGYLMRFWRLFQDAHPYQTAHGFRSIDVSDSPLIKARETLWLDALGGQQENLRYDMLTFYDFVLRLNGWLTRRPGSDYHPKDLELVNEMFGPQLVGTMLKHRLITCTLTKKGTDPRYHLRYFGLEDEHYATLVKALLDDLKSRERIGPEFEASFDAWHAKVRGYLKSVGGPYELHA